MTTLPLRNSIDWSPLRLGFLLIPLALACFTLSPQARAVCQEGCLPNDNTVLGDNALFNNTNFDNTAIGSQALNGNTTGGSNTASGSFALRQSTTGDFNTATGGEALSSNTTGSDNTAAGARALYHNGTGSYNTANGGLALYSNTIGSYNTASGLVALYSNTTGNNNTANGVFALRHNTTGSYNTASGSQALFSNTTGSSNTADGVNALYNNTIGLENTANGLAALASNTTGGFNTANGAATLTSNTTGGNNTATGDDALFSNTTGGDNTATGDNALGRNTTGGSNIALGALAGFNLTTGSNNIDLGNRGVAGESNKIRIGIKGTHTGTFIAGISGVAVTGSQVVVNTNGKLGVATSSARFKKAVKPMDKASEALLALKPVTFRYKDELDPEGIPQFGLVAEQVEKVNPYLVTRDDKGKPYTVRYEAVNAMLLNEFLKEHSKVQELEATVAQQTNGMEVLTARLNEQAAQIQQVSAQLEASKRAPQVVNNP